MFTKEFVTVVPEYDMIIRFALVTIAISDGGSRPPRYLIAYARTGNMLPLSIKWQNSA